jgi:hypothetical protein
MEAKMSRLAELFWQYFAAFSLLDWVNIALAVGCSYVAAKIALRLAHSPSNEDLTQTIVRFKRSGLDLPTAMLTTLRAAETRALVCGLVTTAVGCFGYVLAQLLDRWQVSFDLLLFGGLLSLLLASRRQDEAHAMQSLGVTATIWVAFLLTAQRVTT